MDEVTITVDAQDVSLFLAAAIQRLAHDAGKLTRAANGYRTALQHGTDQDRHQAKTWEAMRRLVHTYDIAATVAQNGAAIELTADRQVLYPITAVTLDHVCAELVRLATAADYDDATRLADTVKTWTDNAEHTDPLVAADRQMEFAQDRQESNLEAQLDRRTA